MEMKKNPVTRRVFLFGTLLPHMINYDIFFYAILYFIIMAGSLFSWSGLARETVTASLSKEYKNRILKKKIKKYEYIEKYVEISQYVKYYFFNAKIIK